MFSKLFFLVVVKGGPSDLGKKILQNTKKLSIYSKSLLIFIHKTPLVEHHPTNGEIKRITTTQIDTNGIHDLFVHAQLAHLHTGNTQKKVSDIASDEDVMQNNNIFVMLWNLSFISHLIFLQCFIWFLAQNLKIASEAT